MADSHGTDVQAHSEHKSHKKEYFVVFVALAVLTGLEIWLAELNMSALKKGSGLTFLAIAKAFLVAYYYMHLKDETKWMKFIAVIPVMAAVYATVLCLEAIYKPF